MQRQPRCSAARSWRGLGFFPYQVGASKGRESFGIELIRGSKCLGEATIASDQNQRKGPTGTHADADDPGRIAATAECLRVGLCIGVIGKGTDLHGIREPKIVIQLEARSNRPGSVRRACMPLHAGLARRRDRAARRDSLLRFHRMARRYPRRLDPSRRSWSWIEPGGRGWGWQPEFARLGYAGSFEGWRGGGRHRRYSVEITRRKGGLPGGPLGFDRL